MKLKKGSKEAKEYMASIRAKKKAPKKLGYAPERLKIVKLTTKIAKDKYIKPGYNAKGRAKAYTIAQKEASKILSRVNGVEKHKDTKSHNVRISVVSGIKKDYAEDLVRYVKMLEQKENTLLILRYKIKAKLDLSNSKFNYIQTKGDISKIKKHITTLKRHI